MHSDESDCATAAFWLLQVLLAALIKSHVANSCTMVRPARACDVPSFSAWQHAAMVWARLKQRWYLLSACVVPFMLIPQ